MSVPLPPTKSTSPEYPDELIQFSAKVEEARRSGRLKSLSPEFHFSHGTSYYGAQLMPLKARDILALSQLFDQDDMEVIQEDVLTALGGLVPAPCWEDLEEWKQNQWDFLAEFLE